MAEFVGLTLPWPLRALRRHHDPISGEGVATTMRVGRRVKGLRHVPTVFVEVASEQRPERTIANTSPTQGDVSDGRPSRRGTLRSDETAGSDAEELAPAGSRRSQPVRAGASLQAPCPRRRAPRRSDDRHGGRPANKGWRNSIKSVGGVSSRKPHIVNAMLRSWTTGARENSDARRRATPRQPRMASSTCSPFCILNDGASCRAIRSANPWSGPGLPRRSP